MADYKELMISDSVGSPEFIQELLPSAERTALLYHLSYLCLGGFPKLERLIRERALETQMLFASSEAVLLKCCGTSSNLVTSLFPMLIKAVEKNKSNLAVRYLEKARDWISDIIRAVDDMVNRYEQQNRSVASCTSDVFQEQSETEKQIYQCSEEIKGLKEVMEKLEQEMKKNTEEIDTIEKQIVEKNAELEEHIKHASRKKNGMGILAALVPFVGPLIKSIVDTSSVPGEVAKTQSLQADLSRLSTEKISLKDKEWQIQVKQTDLQLTLATANIKQSVIPDPVHLKDVQQCLSRIQQILIQLKKFWEKVGSLLDMLKEKTFVNEDLVNDLQDMKEEFLDSIKIAGEYWQKFGSCCHSAQGVFSVQSRDAYKFLEINPSSLTPDERQNEYKGVMEKLNKISPRRSSTAAITQGNTKI